MAMDTLINIFRYKALSIGAILVLSHAAASGQNIIGNDRNMSSLSLNPGFKETKKEDEKNSPKLDTVGFDLGMVIFSTAEKKIEFNYYNYVVDTNFTHYFVGVSSSAELKNSVASVFTNKDLVSQGNINLRLGFRLLKNHVNWDEK